MLRTLRTLSRLFSLTALLTLASGAAAQAYTSIVVIGDSLSDTGNDATVSRQLFTVNAQVPGPPLYANGRFTDGTDTLPAARAYNGVWIEQLAAKLAAQPVIVNSLAGGTNYAYGYATTAGGTGTLSYGPGNVFTIPVNNLGLQVSTYLATSPTITSQTLFVVWGGANDLLQANGNPSVITQAAMREVGLVQQLISAGATDFLIANLPPLGLTPTFNTSTATSAPATAAASGFDQALAAGLATLPAANPARTLHLYSLDTYTLFNTIVAAPATFHFANITAMSQGNAAINPDTYLFWDNLHPTTYGHSLIASTAFQLLQGPTRTTAAVTSSNLTANLNSSITLTANVTATAGSPQGLVTFLDGTNSLGSAYVAGANSTAAATLTLTSLSAGTHSITAAFAGANGYVASTSPAVTETIVPPTYAASASSTNVTVQPGGSTADTISITPAGGYLGSFTVTCTSPLASITCSVGNASLAITGATAVSTTVQVAASASAALRPVTRPGTGIAATNLTPVFALLPFAGMVVIGRRRRRLLRALPLWLSMLALSGVALLGLTGCNNAAPVTPVLNVPVTVIVTPATGAATTLTLNVTVP